jgi:DNA invertase Pin-like site-specific DNA recombinase
MKHTATPYYRWSTPDQKDGDSLRRQEALVASWHAEHPDYILGPALIDAGVSAFHGNQPKLVEFVEEVKQGKHRAGDVLLAESWDRISREHPVDDELVKEIWNGGMGIVITSERVLYSRKTMVVDSYQYMRRVVDGIRAHEESRLKSERLKASWANKREHAATSSRGPAWLKRVNGGWVPIPDRVATIQMLFELYESGRGLQDIVKRLNRNADVWRPSGRWNKSYAEALLKDRRVIGERQWRQKIDGKSVPVGDPVPNYFPVVVDQDLFHGVQAQRAARAKLPDHGGGKSGANSNLFRRIAKCAVCGDRMHFLDKGPHSHPYYQCAKALDGLGCKNNKTIRYDKLEPILLYHTRGLDACALLLDEAQHASANARRLALEGEIAQLDNEMASIEDSIFQPENASIKRRLEARLRDREARRAELELELQQIVVPDAQQVARHLQSVEDLITHMGQLRARNARISGVGCARRWNDWSNESISRGLSLGGASTSSSDTPAGWRCWSMPTTR